MLQRTGMVHPVLVTKSILTVRFHWVGGSTVLSISFPSVEGVIWVGSLLIALALTLQNLVGVVVENVFETMSYLSCLSFPVLLSSLIAPAASLFIEFLCTWGNLV